jgi:WD40 repeat protein
VATFTNGVASIDFSPDGRQALLGLTDGRALIWDMQKHAQARALTPEMGEDVKCLYSPDGKHLFICDFHSSNGKTLLATSPKGSREIVLQAWRAPTLEEIDAAEATKKHGGVSQRVTTM